MSQSTPSPLPSALRGVAILAGGASSRMGNDKALLRCGGRTLLERSVAVAASQELPVFVLGRARAPVPAVAMPDEGGRRGPGEAVADAVQAHGALLILAVDMPWVEPPLLHAVASLWPGHGHGVVARDAKGRLVPTLAVITPRDVASASARAHAVSDPRCSQRGRSLRALVARGARLQVAAAPHMLANVNTPEEARRAGLSSPAR